MTRLWAKTLSYKRVQVGDELPILVKHESKETIEHYARYSSTRPSPGWSDLHADEEFARQGIFGETVGVGTATMAYVAELLEKGFPIANLTAKGSSLEMRATEPVRAGDTITFTGQVTGKLEEDDQRLLECDVVGTNQLGQTVARAVATISFPS